MSWSRVSSFAGVLLAAVASVATSGPPPEAWDWVLDDSVSGQTMLVPDSEYTTVYVKATSRAVSSALHITAAIDPTPAPAASREETPIVLFADVVERNADGSSPQPTRMNPLPSGYPIAASADGYESAAGAGVPTGSQERVFAIRFAWISPDARDRSVDGYDSYKGSEVHTERPLAPRRPSTIRWRADIHAEGYGAKPEGAVAYLEMSQ